MQDSHDNKYYYGISSASFTIITTPPPSPPVEFSSPFKSIEEWLNNLCETHHPEEILLEYHIILMELSWNYVLGLYGIKTIEIDENTKQQLFSTPESNMYFPLPKAIFENLSKTEVKEKVMNELIEFTKSSKFQNSFLSKVNIIRTNFNDKIWSR